VIVFLDYSNDSTVADDRLYILSSPDAMLNPFFPDLPPATIGGPFHVSSNRKWLSFYHGSDLVLTDSNPSDRKVLSGETNKWISNIYGWTADNLRLITPPIDKTEVDGLPPSIVAVDPFTGQQREIDPGIPSEIRVWPWERSDRSVVYDPTLNRVAYLEDAFNIVLWNIETRTKVWRFRDNNIGIHPPVWSSDGAYMAFTYSPAIDHIQIIDRDGGEIVPEIVAQGQITSFGWSPDRRYLTYWSIEAASRGLRLFAFDILTRQLFDTCIIEPNIPALGSSPIWSPDNKQFIVGSAINPDAYFTDWRFRNFVVDIESKQLMQLDNDEIEPIAWLRDEQ
jgi:hypothetical protein